MKNTILWTLFVTPLAQHGKLDQTNAFSYYVGVGSTQQMLVLELMVSFLLLLLLLLHFNLSNNGNIRLFNYTTNVSAGANGKFPTTITINLSNNCTNRLFDYGQA